ncbi:MAG: hypothetical protein HYV07_06410 [Deltaproteobacteria bacterium]|nr:hypothetical protein [Deltaproteobacteria bacterium]
MTKIDHRALALAATAVTACSSKGLELILPALPSETRSILLAVEASNEGTNARRLELSAHPAEDRLLRKLEIELDELSDVRVLAYRAPLSAMLIEPGIVELTTEGRRIPAPDVARHLTEPFTDWTEEPELGPLLEAARIVGVSLERCLGVGGCYSSDDPDAGSEGCVVPCPLPSVPASPAEPELPEAPIAPRLGAPCATGLVERSIEGLTFCAVDLEVSDSCLSEELRDVHAGCAPVGAPCDASGWPPRVPPDAIHVRANAAPGGDGSRERPFASIAEASAEGATSIALASGAHAAPALNGPLHLIGACVEGTSIVTTEIDGDVRLEDLSILGSIEVRRGGALVVERVRGEGIEVAGSLDAKTARVGSISTSGEAWLSLEQTEVDSLELASHSTVDASIIGRITLSAGDAQLHDVVVERGAEVSGGAVLEGARVHMGGECSLCLRDASTASIAGARLVGAWGAIIAPEARAIFEDLELESNGVGLSVDGSVDASRIVAVAQTSTSVAVRGRATLDDAWFRDGFTAIDVSGGSVTARRTNLTNVEVAVRGVGRGTRIELEDFAVGRSPGVAHPGVSVNATESTLSIHRARIEGRPGLHVLGSVDAELEDVAVEGSSQNAFSFRDGTARLTRASCTRCELTNLAVHGTSIVASDLAFIEPRGQTGGEGFASCGETASFLSSIVDLSRISVAGAVGGKGVTFHSSWGRVRDLSIKNGKGYGLYVLDASHIDGERVAIEDNVGAGYRGHGQNIGVRMVDVAIRRTGLAPHEICEERWRSGFGLHLRFDAKLELERFEISGSSDAGALVGQRSTLGMRDGRVFGNKIGAFIETTPFDLRGILDGVEFSDNETNLESQPE